jgi:hypothetical protein
MCKKIGVDTVKNIITRTTPIVVSCNYYDEAIKEMRMFFNFNREMFMFD